eukprot:COSAG05_NODE_7138_length_851_cov_6.382979_1_plen_161_part_10
MHTAAQRGDRRDLAAACDDSLEIGTVDLGDLDLLPLLQPTESHEHMDKINRVAGVRGGDPDHQPAPTCAEPAASLLMHTAAQRGDRRDLAAACDDSLEIGTVDFGDLDLLPVLQPTESHEHMDAVAAPVIGADIVAATDASVEVEPLALAEYVEQLDDLSH